MHLTNLRRSGHWPSLVCAFLYFDVSFMVWVLLGALGNALAADFGLSPFQKGLMVAVPLLGGAVLRLVLGVMTDHLGARRTALMGLTITTVPLILAWLWVESFPQLLLVGAMLGVAGASFAAALPLASRWYPPEQQGLVMGIAGAGNSGTALATLFAPMMVPVVGWRGVFGLALIPILAVLAIFSALAKDAPSQPPPRRFRDYLAVLGLRDTYWFCAFYAVTFGGFVGLISFLPIFFKDQYAVEPIRAGMFATSCALAGSFLRPVGGYLSDRMGGTRMLLLFYGGVGLLTLAMSTSPALAPGVLTLFLIMALLGMGNGAVFQLVPQRFRREIGVITGIVGAAGGLGGFFLPLLLGSMRQWTGSFGPGFLLLALIGGASAGLMALVATDWERRFLSRAGASPAPAHPAPHPEPIGAPEFG